MADFSLPVAGLTVRGDIGVRYAHTRQTSSGHADNGTAAIPVSFERSYDNALPALNLVAEFTSSLQMHLAASKVITRPSLADLAPRLTINSNPTALTAVGGNPELKPFEAWQYDGTLEWYFATGGTFRDALVDVAKDSFNLTAFYEKDRVGARVSYSWRGDVLRDVGGAGLAFAGVDCHTGLRWLP